MRSEPTMRSQPTMQASAYQSRFVRPARIALLVYVVFILAVIMIANIGGTFEMFSFVLQYEWGDKVGHFGLIGVLALLTDLALGQKSWRHVPVGPAIIVVLVTLEELSQLAMTTRTFDLVDLSADLLGVITFVGLGRLLSFAGAKLDQRGHDRERVR
jgi:VanZ family protein